MAIRPSLSVPLDYTSAVVPTEITFTIASDETAKLLLASFIDGGTISSGSNWTNFVASLASFLTGEGYRNVTTTALTTTVA